MQGEPAARLVKIAFHPQGPRHRRPSTCAALTMVKYFTFIFPSREGGGGKLPRTSSPFSALARGPRVPLSRNDSCEFPQRDIGSAVARSTLERTKVSPEDPLSHATFSPHEIGNGGCDDRSSIPSMIPPGRFRRHPLPVAEYEMPASSVYFPRRFERNTDISGHYKRYPRLPRGGRSVPLMGVVGV